MEYKSRKEEQFDSIYQANVNSVLRVAMHYTNNYDTAQEITQAVFFQLYTHLDDVDLETVQPWLITSARNFVFNYSRDTKREILGEAMESIMELEEKIGYADSMEVCYLREEQKILAQELSDSIFAKLYEKNEKWYDALTLVYCLGKSQQEAAEELGIDIVVLHSRIYRAKKWIRKNYEKKYEEVANWL